MHNIPEEAVKAADRAIADIIGKHSNVSTEALARAAIDAGAPFLAPHKMNCADLEEAIRLAEIGEYLYNRSYSYGDGYSEPREYGIEWQWQQTKPNEFGQGALLGEAVRWHKEQAEDGVITEASKLRRALSILSAIEPSAARELALEEGFRKGTEAAAKLIECGCKDLLHGKGECQFPGNCSLEDADAIRALSSPDHADAGKVEGDGWRPIESASKDWTVIDLWSDEYGRLTDCYWGAPMAYEGDETGWVHAHTNEWAESPDEFTHWRPLPSAPSEGGE